MYPPAVLLILSTAFDIADGLKPILLPASINESNLLHRYHSAIKV